MATEDQQGMTPLTEQQAKALADWWGGDYQAMREVSGEDTAVVHGVVMPGEKFCPGKAHRLAIFSLEKATALENRRSSINPGAPDWVG